MQKKRAIIIFFFRIRMEKLALSPVRSAIESKKIIETWDFLNKSKILYLIPDDERH